VYHLKLTSGARRQLDRIQTRDVERIGEAIRNLADNPRPPRTVKLRGQLYRIRIGDWRIIYEVIDKESLVTIGKVVRRSEDTYRDIDEIF